MNSTRISLPNFNSPFSTACFLPIGWFLTQTKSLSGHLTLMSTFLLGNKESGRPGLPRVLTQPSQAQATAGKPILSFVRFIMRRLVFLHPFCRVCANTFLLRRPGELVHGYPHRIPQSLLLPCSQLPCWLFSHPLPQSTAWWLHEKP